MEAKKLEIQTLSVQIKVLTINKKQFTKSVFHQLPFIKSSIAIDLEKKRFRFEVLGYVRAIDGEKVVLIVYDNLLYRIEMPYYSLVANEDGYPTADPRQSIVEKIWQELTPDKQLFISI